MEFVLKLLFCIFVPIVSSRHVQFFRKDYTYIEEFDSFYKLHWDSNGHSWSSAFLTCDDEGAMLFYPKFDGEWALVKNLTEQMRHPPNVSDIFVGYHDKFGLGEYLTVDGHSTMSPLSVEDPDTKLYENMCILMNIDTGSYRVAPCSRDIKQVPLPFVCKKVDNESCPTIDRGYKYIKTSKKCYKVNRRQKTWHEAMETCFMEGGILTIIQNKAEADEIHDILGTDSRYHVGFRKTFSQDEYYTITGETINNVYHRNYNDQLNEDCGIVLNRENHLWTATTDCGSRLPFICEMEVNAKQY